MSVFDDLLGKYVQVTFQEDRWKPKSARGVLVLVGEKHLRLEDSRLGTIIIALDHILALKAIPENQFQDEPEPSDTNEQSTVHRV